MDYETQDDVFWKAKAKRILDSKVVSLVLVFVFFGIPIILVTSIQRKESPVYKEAVARAKSNPVVQKVLGTPIKEGLFTFDRNVAKRGAGKGATVNLSVTLSGPKDTGTLHMIATPRKKGLIFKKLVVKVASTGIEIDLTE